MNADREAELARLAEQTRTQLIDMRDLLGRTHSRIKNKRLQIGFLIGIILHMCDVIEQSGDPAIIAAFNLALAQHPNGGHLRQ